MNLLSFLILSSLTLASRVRGRRHNNSCMPCDIDSSWSSSSSEEEKCRSRNPRYREQYNGLCRKCLSAFNQVNVVLTNTDASVAATVNDAFKIIDQNSTVAIATAENGLSSQLESSLDDLQKEVLQAAEESLSQSIVVLGENISQELLDHVQANKSNVDAAIKNVNGLITALAAKLPLEIVLAIRNQGSQFQLAVSAEILNIHEVEKKDLLRMKADIRKEAATIAEIRIQKTIDRIKEVFAKFKGVSIGKFKEFNDLLKKQIEDVLKATETELISFIVQINRKVTENVKAILSICTEALFGRKIDDFQVHAPAFIPDNRSNPVIN
ncbi:hypothetical protein GINT2_001925 [Glugoides intestinalis]